MVLTSRISPKVAGHKASPTCKICGYSPNIAEASTLGAIRGNTARFEDRVFTLWKCPRCSSIHSLAAVEYSDIYSDYPLNKRRLDIYARGTFRNLTRRLKRAGLQRDSSILDYGCGNGVLIEFLREHGYERVFGYDPYVHQHAMPPQGQRFDCVIANDVIEHVEDPRATLRECCEFVRPGGLLYIGTADAEPVDMTDLEPHLMRLHQPFHRVIITQTILHRLCLDLGCDIVATYRRSYMDTLVPFCNYRFLDELNRALGHNLDLALDPVASQKVVKRKPRLLFFAILGYFFPVAFEPAIVMRRRA